MYVLSCSGCNVEYHFRRRKIVQSFERVCPTCGQYLSCVPIPRYTLTPPPELLRVERPVTVIEIGRCHSGSRTRS